MGYPEICSARNCGDSQSCDQCPHFLERARFEIRRLDDEAARGHNVSYALGAWCARVVSWHKKERLGAQQ